MDNVRKEVHFTVPGEPMGWMRRGTAKGISYTPTKMRNYQNYIKMIYNDKCKGIYFEGPVIVEIWAYLDPPKSASKKKYKAMLDNEILPEKNPDIDNLQKIVFDSLQKGIAFKNDNKIVDVLVHKRWSNRPRLEVSIYSWSKDLIVSIDKEVI